MISLRKAPLFVLAYFSLAIAYAQPDEIKVAGDALQIAFDYLGKDGMNFIVTLLIVFATLYIGFSLAENLSKASAGARVGTTVFAAVAGFSSAYYAFINEIYIVDILAQYSIAVVLVMFGLIAAWILSAAKGGKLSLFAVGFALIIIGVLFFTVFDSGWFTFFGIMMIIIGAILMLIGAAQFLSGKGVKGEWWKRRGRDAADWIRDRSRAEEGIEDAVKQAQETEDMLDKALIEINKIEAAVNDKNQKRISKGVKRIHKILNELERDTQRDLRAILKSQHFLEEVQRELNINLLADAVEKEKIVRKFEAQFTQHIHVAKRLLGEVEKIDVNSPVIDSLKQLRTEVQTMKGFNQKEEAYIKKILHDLQSAEPQVRQAAQQAQQTSTRAQRLRKEFKQEMSAIKGDLKPHIETIDQHGKEVQRLFSKMDLQDMKLSKEERDARRNWYNQIRVNGRSLYQVGNDLLKALDNQQEMRRALANFNRVIRQLLNPPANVKIDSASKQHINTILRERGTVIGIIQRHMKNVQQQQNQSQQVTQQAQQQARETGQRPPTRPIVPVS